MMLCRYKIKVSLVIAAALSWMVRCQGRTIHSNETELIDEGDYFDGDEENRSVESDTQRRQHVLQRSPQQQQFPPLYSSMLVPNANVQANPLRLPNVLSLPPGAPARWVQPVGNGLPVANPNLPLPANPNLPAGGQRYVLMPVTPGDVKTTPPPQPQPAVLSTKPPLVQQQPQPVRQLAVAPAPLDPTVGRPWDLPPGPAPIGALPGAPLTHNAGQKLIVLPNGGKPMVGVPTVDSSKLIRQPFQPSPTAPSSGERPVIPQAVAHTAPPPEKPTAPPAPSPVVKVAAVTTAPAFHQQTPHPKPHLPSFIPRQVNETEPEDEEEEEVVEVKPKLVGTKIGRPIGVHTTHGRLLLEPHVENYCDMRQYSDEQLLAKNLQRVEYFVANLTCSRYFFECAIGQTFLLNCTSKDQVFDINTVNCNFKYNVKSCNEYDHILHCSIQEECQQDQFACCAEPQQCLSYSKRCDGIADCNDGEDENNCPSCGVDEFPCVKSGKCISWDKRCNGIPDECYDQTNLDEQNCGGCPPEKFTCGRVETGHTATCIDVSLRCNGIRDCPRGEDELNCKSKGQKYLLCENQKQSVSKEQWCDGYEDCLDGSDEKYCIY